MTAIKIKPLLLKLVKACSAIDKQASGVAAMKLQRKTGVKREDHLAVRSGKKCYYLLVPADLPNKLPNSNDGQAQQANNRCLSLIRLLPVPLSSKADKRLKKAHCLARL
jgi:hypothetical protein